jgi:hypothetical protein
MMTPAESRRMIGMSSTRGRADMMTAAACTPVRRIRPSSPFARSVLGLTSTSSSYKLAQLTGLVVARMTVVEDAAQRDRGRDVVALAVRLSPQNTGGDRSLCDPWDDSWVREGI